MLENISRGQALSITAQGFSYARERGAVTIFDMGRIAARYDTLMAHAMLQAVAVARARL